MRICVEKWAMLVTESRSPTNHSVRYGDCRAPAETLRAQAGGAMARLRRLAFAGCAAALVCAGCGAGPTGPDSQAQLFQALVQQAQQRGALDAKIELFYEVGSGNFDSDVNPVPKEAAISFEPNRTWTAYFASEPSRIYPGRYKVEVTEPQGGLAIEILHDGASADGSDNLLVLNPDGTFRETSVAGTGEASGVFAIALGSP